MSSCGVSACLRGIGRQVVQVLVRVGALNSFTAVGTPITGIGKWVCPGKGGFMPAWTLCNSAEQRARTRPIRRFQVFKC